MREVTIGFEKGDQILIRVSGREGIPSTDWADGNWLPAEVTISCGVFSGTIKHDVFLRAEEFELFLKEIDALYDSLEGTAKFATMEDWLVFEVTGDGKGHMLAKGYLIDGHVDGNKLNFVIKFDQTALSKTIRDLKKLLEEYPVVGK